MKKQGILTAIICLCPALISANAQTSTMRVHLPSGAAITAEVADTPPKRLLGLMFREELPLMHGMLFIFDGEDYHGIWMKNCRIPLDILWLDRNARVIHMEEQAPPCRDEPCRIYYPVRKALFVLEINAGLITREKIRLGAQLKF